METNGESITRSTQNKDIVIYGLSTEGYEIAKRILQHQPRVVIIDENSRLGISLTPKIVKEYPNIAFLMEEELLLNLEPFDKSISGAPIIFFVPRIRKTNYDVKNDIIPKFKEIISNLKKNTSIVFNIPLGIGGNTEIITLIEHLSGFTVGTDIFYYYNPLDKIESAETIIGSYQQISDTYFSSTINLIYKIDKQKLKILSISSAELLYTINIVNRYSNMTSINEITKINRIKEIRSEISQNNIEPIYFDEIVNGLFDLRILSLSLTNSSALGYIVNGTIRSIEGFAKSLIEEIRIQLKLREIKASRTKVTILWTIDNNEMRGDKTIMLESLKLKLRDYIAEVDTQSIENYLPNTVTNIIIACSSEDYKKIISKIDKNHHHNSKIIVVSANTFFNTVEI
ncbi:MAG: hypothetical protein M3M87_05515 [Thermoproteota archaeon]|nr:hypothetical protein [Thermoproteota archaeon]